MIQHNVEINATAGSTVTATPTAGRGETSWNNLWMLLALALSVEASVIQLMSTPCLLLLFLVVALLTVFGFLSSHAIARQIRERVINWKASIERNAF